MVGLPARRAPQHRLRRAHLRDQFEGSRNHCRRPQPCRRFALLDHPRASTTRLSRFVKILTPTASACCARAAASIRRKAFIGHRLDSRQRESCISQLQTRESDLVRCPRGQEKCATCALFSILPQRARKSWTAWRRGGDSNPRDPFESTRVPGVRLKPGSATSPRELAIMHQANSRSHRADRFRLIALGRTD